MSKLIANVFHIKNNLFTNLYENIDFHNFVNKIILFDLKIPIIIVIKSDFCLFQKIVVKFSNANIGNFILDHIDFKKKLNIDGAFSIMDDMLYLNHNIIQRSPYSMDIYKANVKLFFSKNLLIIYDGEYDNSLSFTGFCHQKSICFSG